ncbi:MAG: sulfatase [Gemmatimonadaceae bacterium]
MTALRQPVPDPAISVAAPAPAAAPVSRSVRIREILLLWIFASLATGAWHVNKMVLKHYVVHHFTWTPRDILWMSPLGNLLLLAVPTAFLVLLALLSPRFVPRWLATFVPVFFAATGMLLIVAGLENYAIMVLAAGIAMQAARMVGSNGDRWLPRIKLATIALGAVLMLAGASSRVWRNSAEWRWRRTAASAPADAPNVLILLLDTVRAENLGLYGYARATSPVIDSVGRDATVFNQAFSTAGWTLPSHCSFFTGRYPEDNSCGWNTAMSDSPRTVAEVFRDHGWRTAGFAANPFYATHESGLARGFTRWEDFNVSLKQIICGSTLAQTGILRKLFWSSDDQDRFRGLKKFALKGDPKPEVDLREAETIGGQFVDWLGVDGARPFFAYLNFFDAHEPYQPPEAFRTKFAAKPKDRDRYDGGIAYMDQEVGRILSELSKRGVLDRTLVVIVGDHGEQFGEHNVTTHGNSLYVQLVHVPLIMRLPGKIPAGARVNRSVTLVDLPRTLLQVAGIADTAGILGTSLIPAITDSAYATSAIRSETEQTPRWTKTPTFKGPMSALMDQRYHYIRSVTGAEWLFDYRADPAEKTDLVKDPQMAAIVQGLRADLLAHQKASRPPSDPTTP